VLEEMPASIKRVVSSVKFGTLKTVSEFVSCFLHLLPDRGAVPYVGSVCSAVVSGRSGQEGSYFCYWSEGNYVSVRT
jgi:hypothetical protein